MVKRRNGGTGMEQIDSTKALDLLRDDAERIKKADPKPRK